MPFSAPQICRGGCGKLVRSGYCDACEKSHGPRAQAERRRPNAYRRGYTPQWNKYSHARLKEFPLCVGYPPGYHGDVLVAATLTDHIESARKAPERFMDPDNHQSLCDGCNKRKAIAEEGAFS